MFRRSASAVTYFVDGRVAGVREQAFLDALERHRFRSIEQAASEETSIGWVTPADPTGDSFVFEDMDLEAAVWLRVRLDRKTLPSPWVQIHRSAAERSAGRRLSTREKRELREDLLRKLLPRVLPTVTFLDALYDVKAKTIILFSTAKRSREEFEKLFFRTFGTGLVAGNPGSIALRVGLDRQSRACLQEASPIRWPRSGGRRATMAEPIRAEASE